MTKLSFYVFLLLSFSYPVSLNARKSAVTYTFNWGRLGDNLLAYSHAKWISYLYDIPLLYRPFEYSDQLMMHLLEEPLTQGPLASYDKKIDISQVDSFTIEPDAGILYIIPYFPESIVERPDPRFFFYFPVNWDDKGFKTELKKMICPIKTLERPSIPQGVFSIALHIRVGTGFDIPTLADYPKLTAAAWCQLKCPPFSFYVQQLQTMLKWFSDKELYIYMFTDHENPQEFVDYFQRMLNNKVKIHTRSGINRHNLNVLEDLFAMADSDYFDCIIRPDSNLSIVASKLADDQLQISPWHCSIINNEYVIDQICVNNKIFTIQSTEPNADSYRIPN